MTDRINAGQFTWKDDFKDVHPSPFGQKIYSDTICRLLDMAWQKPLCASDAVQPHWLPEKPIDAFSYFHGRLEDIRKADIESGWTLDPAWHPMDKVEAREGFVDVPMLTAEKSGAVLRFPFTGSAVGLFITAGPDCGIIEYSVDGKPFRQVDQFTTWSPDLYIPWALMLETELDSGPHELVLKTCSQKNARSKGTACRIVHFLVNN
ncbi:MAG: hypothetical protein JXB18_15190 [Sedimentisphaerales bacterium]|nr:hypothetical protein [Sedimentisphaerales bacterium]